MSAASVVADWRPGREGPLANGIGLRAGPALDPAAMSEIRRRAVLDGCKWDPQVGDTGTLAPFPLVMSRRVWRRLATQAERLASEAMAAEEEILRRSELLWALGLPRPLRRVLAGREALTPAAGRVIRFDFHPTREGWRISEANSDVPGGFSEASHFTGMMAAHFPDWQTAGDPAAAWADTLAAATSDGGLVALVSAPGHMEDHQVVAFLAARLRERGRRTGAAKPEQITWRDGRASVATGWCRGSVDVIVRFHQAEWLSALPAKCRWEHFFRGGRVLVANSGVAVISESKRFPLVWDRLATALPAWRELLPETRDPREAPWETDDDWLLKTAFCNTGDTVSSREWMPRSEWFRARRGARWFPGSWLAQKRFESTRVDTPAGARHVCAGVYTVNGRAAGAYARLSERPVIDFAAVDAALLIEDDE
jgi:hypothetical protein